MHFKWEKPYRIRHRIEKIKSWTMRKNMNSRKGAEFIPNFKNCTCIFKGKTQIWHRIEKIKSSIMRTMRINLSSMDPRYILSSSRRKKPPKLDVILSKESIKSSREFPFCHMAAPTPEKSDFSRK